ncbi:MAG: recombinase XerD [Kangiella sp.]|nr:MAG: recombinase XerD [Kangiella sp.]
MILLGETHETTGYFPRGSFVLKKNDNELVSKWLTFKLTNEGCADSTIDKYRGYLSRLSDYLENDLVDTGTDDLVDFTGLHLHESGAAPSSRRAVVAAVKSFYKWATVNKLCLLNPAENLVYPKKRSLVPIAMSLKNSEKLLMQPDISTFKGLRDAAVLALFIGTGARLHGIINLNKRDLITFEYQGIDRLAVKLKEKGSKERIVPVPPEAALLLRAYLGHDELSLIDTALPNGDHVVFVNLKNNHVPSYEHRGEARRLGKRGIQQMIKDYSILAGVPESQAHAHAFRHLVGAELAEESATPFEMMAILGHAQEDTTAIYAQLALRKLTEVLDRANPLGKIETRVSPLVKEFKARGYL